MRTLFVGISLAVLSVAFSGCSSDSSAPLAVQTNAVGPDGKPIQHRPSRWTTHRMNQAKKDQAKKQQQQSAAKPNQTPSK